MDRLTAIRDWVTGQGGAVAEISSLQAGLGDTELWKVRYETGNSALVRVFMSGNEASARREVLAMKAALSNGVPVPEVLAEGLIDGRAVLLTEWCDGLPAMAVLGHADAERARSIGFAMGRVEGLINLTLAPEGLSSGWFERVKDVLKSPKEREDERPAADRQQTGGGDRLLHLDYHPLNVLLTPDDEVAGVIDWANAMAGPSHLDLARSLAIVRSVAVGMAETPIPVERLTAFCDGLVAGHAEVAGPDPAPAFSAAWAAAWTYADLANHVGKAGSWVTPEVLERLRADRDAVVAESG